MHSPSRNTEKGRTSANKLPILGVLVRDNNVSQHDIRSKLDTGPIMPSDLGHGPDLQLSKQDDAEDDVTAIGKIKEHRELDGGQEQGKPNDGVGPETAHKRSSSEQHVSVSHNLPLGVFVTGVTSPVFDPINNITAHATMDQKQKDGDTIDTRMEPFSRSISPRLDLLSTPKGNKTKHKPVSPQGTIFLWKDNMQYHDLGNTPFKLNEPKPDLLVLKLRATTGTIYSYNFPEKDKAGWSSQSFITRANRWFHQIIVRHLDNNPANVRESTKRPSRPQWSLQEQNYLHDLIEMALEQSDNGRLTEHEWEDITTKQNDRFVGDMMRIGQGFVDLHAAKNDKKSEGMRKGWGVTNTIDKPFTARPIGGCKSAIKCWPKTKDMIANAAEDAKIKKKNTKSRSRPFVDRHEEGNEDDVKKDKSKKRKPEVLVSDDDEFNEAGDIKSPIRLPSTIKRRKSVAYADEDDHQ